MKNPFSKKAPSQQEAFLRTYLDRIAPGVVKFEVDHYIFGSTYRCVWALREYPASTEAQALLRELGEKSGVTLRIYCRQVSPGEEDRIIDNANKKNKLDGSDPNKLRQAVAAESNLRDVAELVHKMHREHEPLVHCAVYGTTATCRVSIAKPGKTIHATLQLWQGRTMIDSWSGNGTSYLLITGSHEVTKGKTYTVKVVCTVDGQSFYVNPATATA